jgi:hypothetical protein
VDRRTFHKMLMDLVREDIETAPGGSGSSFREAVAQFMAGGLLGLVFWWVDASKPDVGGRLELREHDFW